MLTGPWAEAGAAYGARWGQLMRSALGPLADDADAMTILRAVLDVGFFESVRSGDRTTEEACALITSAIVPWFTMRWHGDGASAKAATRIDPAPAWHDHHAAQSD